jgi:hypothetical protein
MKQISNKEYEAFLRYKKDKNNSAILQPDTIRTICESYNYDPEKIGLHFLAVLAEMRSKHPEYFPDSRYIDEAKE